MLIYLDRGTQGAPSAGALHSCLLKLAGAQVTGAQMANFSPVFAAIGGALIGLAAILLLLING
jgi:hypothetical protein